jgi:hypothetical protein
MAERGWREGGVREALENSIFGVPFFFPNIKSSRNIIILLTADDFRLAKLRIRLMLDGIQGD